MSEQQNEIPKVYDHLLTEDRLYAEWESKNYFAPKGSGDPFCIVIPPPNVTGTLHMGHALDETLQDILTRYHRMKGDSTLWLPGTDHAGIATQNVVERELKKEKLDRHMLGREKFVERVWQWKERYGNIITKQLRHLGASCDWTRERFTMDEGCSKAVREVFVTLYEEGLIYKGHKIINWCPRCLTALSDIEVPYVETKGHLWHFKYPFADNPKEGIVVATTRPETMLGDTAVAVHPEDHRYKHLIGKKVRLPIANRDIPIIGDELVERTFGTGAVKVTPAHDPNDHEMGLRHHMEPLIIMDEKGVLNENTPEAYRGISRFKAREMIVAQMQDEGLLVEVEDHAHNVGHCYRCNEVVEPYLSEQWFVNMKPLAKKAIEVVESGEVEFTPARWKKVYLDWMENIRDWCISRQIWWGHRLPVWYCSCGELIVARETPAQCPVCGSTELKQEEDVLDTWFSSALWPFSTLGWPDKTEDLTRYYPTSVLVTGYDIIFFWVARMITMGTKFMGKVPFKKVFIHGLIRDAQGRKMSKSTGNAVDPLDTIKKYGADSLRFTLASMVTAGGQDLKLSEDKVAASRNFMNKIWNVTRFFLMQEDKESVPSFADIWIESRFNTVLREVTAHLEKGNFGEAAALLYDFTWSEFCDWYVEMFKLGGDTQVFLRTLLGLLRMLHPFIPFLTEELWQRLGHSMVDPSVTIIHSAWPMVDVSKIDASVEKHMVIYINVIRSIRNLRAEMNVPASKFADIVLVAASDADRSVLQKGEAYIKALARVHKVDLVPLLAFKPREAAMSVVPGVEIYMPLANLINIEAEVVRLRKEMAKTDEESMRIKNKLANESFVKRAPVEVIEKEKEKERELLTKHKVLSEQIASLTGAR